jgi:hypothetical protein
MGAKDGILRCAARPVENAREIKMLRRNKKELTSFIWSIYSELCTATKSFCRRKSLN